MYRDPDEAEASRLHGILDGLYAHYGRPEFDEADDLLGVLISAILSQSTTNANSRRSFGSLIDRFDGDWQRIAGAEVEEVIEAIEVGGLARQKAPRIQSILRRIHEEQGNYDLGYVGEMSADEAKRELQGFPGVGPKTAAFALMYAAGFDVFPMDTHIFRILERLEFLDGNKNDADAHAYAESLLRDGEAYPAHMVLVEHGRKTCHARKPECSACVIRSDCPFSEE